MPLPLSALSGMPQMSAAFAGWKSRLTFEKITQVVENGWVSEIRTPVTVMGVWQPQSPEDIKLKPEGQWSWSWFMLHIEGTDNSFQTNDRLIFRGVQYKVMAKRDYTLNNYVQLELIEDFQGSPDV